MKSFDEIVTAQTLNALNKKNIETPLLVQSKVIPLIYENNNDYIIVSKTGSGKTLAYLIPLIEKLNKEVKTPQVLIVTPTHELASQVYEEVKYLSSFYEYKVLPALLIGGSNILKQQEKLKEKPNIVVGTSGRIIELIELKKLKMHTVNTIVLDEGDRLLDELNETNVKKVIKSTLRDRRLLYFSASVDDNVISLCNEIMKTPELIEIEKEVLVPTNITHNYIVCDNREKIDITRKLIRGLNLNRAIVFVNNQDTINDIVTKLNYHKIKAVGIHGSHKKNDRITSLRNFRNGSKNILVTSDVMCRGLDVDLVDCIINIDIPESETLYQHRAGRTGRANNVGLVINIVNKSQVKFIHKYEKSLKISISNKKMINGNLVDN